MVYKSLCTVEELAIALVIRKLPNFPISHVDRVNFISWSCTGCSCLLWRHWAGLNNSTKQEIMLTQHTSNMSSSQAWFQLNQKFISILFPNTEGRRTTTVSWPSSSSWSSAEQATTEGRQRRFYRALLRRHRRHHRWRRPPPLCPPTKSLSTSGGGRFKRSLDR